MAKKPLQNTRWDAARSASRRELPKPRKDRGPMVAVTYRMAPTHGSAAFHRDGNTDFDTDNLDIVHDYQTCIDCGYHVCNCVPVGKHVGSTDITFNKPGDAPWYFIEKSHCGVMVGDLHLEQPVRSAVITGIIGEKPVDFKFPPVTQSEHGQTANLDSSAFTLTPPSREGWINEYQDKFGSLGKQLSVPPAEEFDKFNSEKFANPKRDWHALPSVKDSYAKHVQDHLDAFRGLKASGEVMSESSFIRNLLDKVHADHGPSGELGKAYAKHATERDELEKQREKEDAFVAGLKEGVVSGSMSALMQQHEARIRDDYRREVDAINTKMTEKIRAAFNGASPKIVIDNNCPRGMGYMLTDGVPKMCAEDALRLSSERTKALAAKKAIDDGARDNLRLRELQARIKHFGVSTGIKPIADMGQVVAGMDYE